MLIGYITVPMWVFLHRHKLPIFMFYLCIFYFIWNSRVVAPIYKYPHIYTSTLVRSLFYYEILTNCKANNQH